MKHVAVLTGGWSAERPISLDSGRGCAGPWVTRIDVDRSVAESLARFRPDVAFNGLHGPALGVIEIQPVSETFYGYDAKYAKVGSRHVLPADLKPNLYHKVQHLTLMAHQALWGAAAPVAPTFGTTKRRVRRASSCALKSTRSPT
jgi:D-alanine-D-alanine ligase-like ATP-grasp enzyme